jgi:uncharacterized glyoxalase superfamily protein PhnB
MHAKSVIPCINVPDAVAARDWYVRHFDATVTFDCGWYVALRLGPPGAAELTFMAPPPGADEAVAAVPCPPFGGEGLTYNLEVEDPDAEHDRLVAAGLEVIMALEDHPWGDRGFAVADPYGVTLYLYRPTEPDEAFRPFVKE